MMKDIDTFCRIAKPIDLSSNKSTMVGRHLLPIVTSSWMWSTSGWGWLTLSWKALTDCTAKYQPTLAQGQPGDTSWSTLTGCGWIPISPTTPEHSYEIHSPSTDDENTLMLTCFLNVIVTNSTYRLWKEHVNQSHWDGLSTTQGLTGCRVIK